MFYNIEGLNMNI